MQEQFLVHRLYSVFLKKKMEKEMGRFMFIEDAFQRIRTATGISDVQQIVSKFLTREQAYSHLLSAVSENERKSDKLRHEHESLAMKLHELQMEHEGEQENGGRGKHDGPYSPEVEELDKNILKLTKEKDEADELSKKVHLVNDQVEAWCNRVIQKVDQQFNENIGAHCGSKTLAFLFEQVAQAVCRQLEQLKIEEDDEDRGYITAKDFMSDFATEEFLSKNIRVRPLSGVTRGDDDGKTNDGFNKSLGDAHGGQDPDEKYHEAYMIQMEENRKEEKLRRKLAMEKQRLEEEKAAKKKR